MKILLISPMFQPAWDWGGPVRSMWNLARGLRSIGHNVEVLTTNVSQKGRMDVRRRSVEEGVEIDRYDVVGRGKSTVCNRYGFSPSLWVEIAKRVGDNEIVHMSGFWGTIQAVTALSCSMRRVPYVVSTRGGLQEDAIRDKRLKKEIALRLGTRRILREAGAIHYTTELERRMSPEWAQKYPSFIVPNPMEIRPKADGADLRERLRIRGGDVVLGAFGRIHKRKGFDVLIPALNRVVRGGKSVVLVVAGPDEGYRDKLEKAVRNRYLEKRVKIMGELRGKELDEAYETVDMLVLPAHGENFGNVVAEAAIQGTPAMVSDHLGLMDWVKEKEAGVVIPLDPDSWAQEIQKLERGRIQELWPSERISKIAIDSFSMESVAESMAANYRTVSRGDARWASRGEER